MRWFQYGVFCPLFRLHGYRAAQPGPPVRRRPTRSGRSARRPTTIIKELLFLRERLRPYIMEQMALAHEKGTPPMRPLFFDFPGDPGCADVDDQFMFGPDLLVAPVLDAGRAPAPRSTCRPGRTGRTPGRGISWRAASG